LPNTESFGLDTRPLAYFVGLSVFL